MEKASQVYESLAVLLFSQIPDFDSPKVNSSPTHHGLDSNVIDSLSKLTLEEQRFITTRAENFLNFQFNQPVLSTLLSDLQRKQKDQEIENRFILNSATSRMMGALFGMHTTEFSARRKTLGLAGKGQHRPAKCDLNIELDIIQYWHEAEQMEERERYMHVSQKSEQAFNVVWPAIQRALKTSKERPYV